MVLVFAGCATPSTHEPPNLYPHKQQIRAYVDGGQYERDLATVAQEANQWVKERAARGGAKLTVVFDLDETLFMNWREMSQVDLGDVSAEWEKWVEAADAPPIESVREVYRTARRLGLDVVFITGRPERVRSSTERNLRRIDCPEFALMICKPNGDRGTSAAFKTAARQKLAAEGRIIIANIGDQESDLVG